MPDDSVMGRMHPLMTVTYIHGCTGRYYLFCFTDSYLFRIPLAASSGKRNASVWRPSVCPIFFPTLMSA